MIAETVYLNGRFLSQPMTGVQRFCTETATAIDRLIAEQTWPHTVMLTPNATAVPAGASSGNPYRKLCVEKTGRWRGQMWEQAELPGAARQGILVNLGNTAPLLTGRRQVLVIHDAGVFDTPESYSPRFRVWYKTLHRCLSRAGVTIVTVSEFSRKRIATHLGLDPRNIPVTYEGADHILRTQADMAVLEKHDLRPREFVLVVASRVPHKNHEALRATADALRLRGVVIAVVGGTNPNVFGAIGDFGAPGRTLNRVTDAELRALYENASCLLFPSRYEGFGLPPVEAMACNCPVIAARGGAVEEVCGDAALYYTNGDDRSLVRAVEALLDDETTAASLRLKGQARAAALSWDASARVLGEALRRAH